MGDVAPWWEGGTFLTTLDELPELERNKTAPLRLPILSKYKDLGCVIEGKVEQGTIKPGDKTIEVDYVDTKFESGATWTAKASVPLEGDNLIDDAKLTLTRAWSW